ncbi:MAG: LLM class flavin-dependent oxidoreductase, partial [Acidimicrobiales bacterium]|nr:LLM class flavin-dependent oxidoreductase [Acidimicrobiales bacterium]
VASNPKPVQPSIPIVVGGHSTAAAKRAGRLGDGFFPGEGNIPELVDIVRQTAADHGRDPESIEITVGANQDLMGADPVAGAEELTAQGVDRAIVPSFLFLNDTRNSLGQFGEHVVAKVSG